jgi:hypothetical protein
MYGVVTGQNLAPHSIGGFAKFSVDGRSEAITGKIKEVTDRFVNESKMLNSA